MARAQTPNEETTRKKRVAILISGRGSNMQALVAAAVAPAYGAEIAVVISNRPSAPGLAWAAEQGITTAAIDHTAFASREDFDAALDSELVTHAVDLIACAGFMRILTDGFVTRWMGRMLNIHPSLLPSFKGLHTHEQALAAGVKIAGCTVHLVSPELDSGPILGQAAVPVLPDDTPTTLSKRVLKAEHALYPRILHEVAVGKTKVSGNTVIFQSPINQTAILFSPPE